MKPENKFFLEIIKITVKENMGQKACFLIKISLNGSNTSALVKTFQKGNICIFFKKNCDSLHTRLNSHPRHGLQEKEAQKG